MLIVDAHEDLAWNILTTGRDYTLSSKETRHLEEGTPVPLHNGDAMLGWPDYQHGRVGLVFATLFALPERHRSGVWDTIFYSNASQANKLYRDQIDIYKQLVDDHPDKFQLIRSKYDLTDLQNIWKKAPVIGENEEIMEGNPVGLMILMEGADGVREPGELEDWWQAGVRIIGPAWVSTIYSGGWKEPGPLTRAGFALLEQMGEFGFGLDMSHIDEKAALQALDVYPGVILASHSNAQSLLRGDNSNRHLSDQIIRGILERDGVIGINFYNAFLKSGWKHGDRRGEVTLASVIEQIDYLCQMAGDAAHVGIGTDLEGGFGSQSAPVGIDSIADLPNLTPCLVEKGYSSLDCEAILGGNWLRIAEKVLPE